MENTRHEIGNVTMITPSDTCIMLKQGSDAIFMSIDEARTIAALVDEIDAGE